MSNYYILIYPLIYARHLEGNKQDGLRLNESYIQFFFSHPSWQIIQDQQMQLQ